MKPSKRLGLSWFRARPVAAGVLWGVLQAVLFYTVILKTFVGVVPPQFLALALPMSFLFGYLLRDFDKSIRAMLVCQGVTWLLVVAVLEIFSPEFRDLLFSSNPSRLAVFAVVAIVGTGIFWFFLGLVGSLLGAWQGESRERT